MAKRKDIIVGEKFSKLTVLAEIEAGRWSSGQVYRRVSARCDCGTIKDYAISDLWKGSTKSCGCERYWYADKRGTRGHAGAGTTRPEYFTWMGMIARCEKKSNNRYEQYGARGIRVCDEWHNFECFLRDMGPRPSKKHTIDRIKNDVGYEPGNCRWATYSEQALNRRSTVMVEWEGIIQPLASLANREIGVTPSVLLNRVKKYGWPIERAISEPVKPRCKAS